MPLPLPHNNPQEAVLTTPPPPARNPRYEPHENPSPKASAGFGAQFSLIASATLLVTPVIVAKESGMDESYLIWMVFASLIVVGISTLLQVHRIGPVGGGAVLPMFTAAFSIPFCITAVEDGGPALLTTLVLVSAIVQLIISKWLVILRRIVTPIVGGIVMMILSVTLASVVFALLDTASEAEPTAAPLTALATMIVVAAVTLRRSAVWRLWGPLIGIVVGCAVAAGFGIYDVDRLIDAPWIGLPGSAPGLSFDFGVSFWTLLPAFLFLGVIISIQANGEAISLQRVSWRDDRAVDFRQVQGALAGTGICNVFAALASAVPNAINPAIVAFTQTTGVASRRIGYIIGLIFILVAFLPKVSALLSTLPGPVMTGYLIMVTGTLFVDGARTVIQSENDRQKVIVAGVCFWIGASFQFGLFNLPDVNPVVGALLKSGITTGGLAAIVMILYLEFTNPRRMRFQSKLDVEALPELNQFITRFANRRGWDNAMKERLSAVAEETLLTLAPPDFLGLDGDDDADEALPAKDDRRLVVIASSEGPIADLEFIGGGNDANMEDRLRQLQQHDSENPVENEISLRLLRSYASSVKHQQFHDTDIITVRVTPPGS